MATSPQLNSAIQETLSRQVRAFRTEAGLTQQMLADKCGIYRTYLSRIEGGDANPSLNVLAALADTLNIEIHQLLVE
jgi:transcriptional regulator with XRE-family HTH domain